MLLSAVSVLVAAQSSSEIPEGLMNNPVCCVLLNPESILLTFNFINTTGCPPQKYLYLLDNPVHISIKIHKKYLKPVAKPNDYKTLTTHSISQDSFYY